MNKGMDVIHDRVREVMGYGGCVRICHRLGFLPASARARLVRG